MTDYKEPAWDTSLPDWEERIIAGRSLVPVKPLFSVEADKALMIFKSLPMADAGSGVTFGDVCGQWVFDFVGAIFGAYDPDHGKQLIEEFFLLISKKNGKSTIAAGIMMTALLLNTRKYAELLILAPTREVAENAFTPAAAMVREDERLAKYLQVHDHLKIIRHLKWRSTLRVVSADSKTAAGKKASFVLIDELWAFGNDIKAAAMLQEATGGLISRPEGFVIYLSTQADDPPAGVFKEKLDFYRDLRDGKIQNKTRMGVLYEFPKRMIDDESYLEPENFYMTNPNMGRSVNKKWIANKLSEISDEHSRRTFLAKHLNVEIGQNLRSNRWAGAEFWSSQTDKGLNLETLLERSEAVVVGIDGGGLDDLFGLCVLGRERTKIVEGEDEEETTRWLSWCHAWAHEGVLERRKSIASRLRDFAQDGDLTLVDDQLADISAIIEIIASIKERGKLAHVGVDPAGLGEMIENLADIGVTQDDGVLAGVPQGQWMMNALKTAERKLANGTLWHAGGSLMAWCVGNLKIEPTATGIRATKQNAGDAKIDPAMALFDAVTMMMRMPKVNNEGTMEDYFASLMGAA